MQSSSPKGESHLNLSNDLQQNLVESIHIASGKRAEGKEVECLCPKEWESKEEISVE